MAHEAGHPVAHSRSRARRVPGRSSSRSTTAAACRCSRCSRRAWRASRSPAICPSGSARPAGSISRRSIRAGSSMPTASTSARLTNIVLKRRARRGSRAWCCWSSPCRRCCWPRSPSSSTATARCSTARSASAATASSSTSASSAPCGSMPRRECGPQWAAVAIRASPGSAVSCAACASTSCRRSSTCSRAR